MNSKADRKNAIASIVNSNKIHTQEELVSALDKKGISVTQATLSRDIKEMGVVKVSDSEHGQYYSIPRITSSGSRRCVEKIDVSGQLCVLHTQPGFASPIASSLDSSDIPGIMGTIAGDDTVLVMLRENVKKADILPTLRSMFCISDITVRTAGPGDLKYAEDICEEIYISSFNKEGAFARRKNSTIRVTAVSDIAALCRKLFQ